MRHLICMACVLGVLLAARGASAQTAVQDASALQAEYDLGQAVERGLAANPTILAARASLSGAEFGRKSALGEFGPKLNLSYGYTHDFEKNSPFAAQQDVWTGNLNLNQPVFTGFRLLSDYQRAKLLKDQSEAQLYQAELALILAVQTAFFDLLQARMDVRSGEDSVARLESQLKVTQAFYDVGLRPRLDVLQAEVDLATARQNLLIAQNGVSTATARLNTLLDLPVDNPTTYVGELGYQPFELALDSCLDRAYRSRPDLQIGRKSVEIAEKDAKIVASDFYPQVSANADYFRRGDDPGLNGFSGDDDADAWQVGAQMNWNAFEWGATKNAYRQAKQNVSRLESELANTRLGASFSVKSNLLAIQEAADRIDVARKSLEAAKEGFRQAQARYQAQVGTSTDVLDAQSRVTDSEAQLIQALSDYQNNIAQLYFSMGEKNLDLTAR